MPIIWSMPLSRGFRI
ncbi:MAG: hypothetical protein RQM95_13720 [Syntrophaceticus schinkii]